VSKQAEASLSFRGDVAGFQAIEMADAAGVVSRLPLNDTTFLQPCQTRPFDILAGMIRLAWRRSDWRILLTLLGLLRRWGGLL